MTKAILFDLGDTLVLTDHWDYDKCLINMFKSLQNEKLLVSTAYRDFRIKYFEMRNKMYLESEPTLREVDFSQRIKVTLKEFNCDLYNKKSALSEAIKAFFDSFIEDLRMDENTPTLLARLKKKHKLAVVSNFAHAPGFWKVLQYFDLPRFFDALVVSAEVGFRKPHPRIFETALESLNVKAKEALFVGDSLKADIYGAKMMGLKTVYVENAGLRKNPYAIAGELDPFPIEPDVKIPNLQELLNILPSVI